MRVRNGVFLFIGACVAVVVLVHLATHLRPPAPVEAPVAAVAPPTPPALPPLTEVQVGEHPIHMVPDSGPPIGGGQAAMDMRRPEAPPPSIPSYSPTTPVPAGPTPSSIAARQFSGEATASGPTSLQVGTISVRLFGVKAPLPGNKCTTALGEMPCTHLAQQALTAKLGTTHKVMCRVPNPKPGVVLAFAICLNESGVDLGGYLIGEGLAVSDTSQSYDYVGAEGIAKNLKHGLWRFQ